MGRRLQFLLTCSTGLLHIQCGHVSSSALRTHCIRMAFPAKWVIAVSRETINGSSSYLSLWKENLSVSVLKCCFCMSPAEILAATTVFCSARGKESQWLPYITIPRALWKLVRKSIIDRIKYSVQEQLLNPADVLNIFSCNLNRAVRGPVFPWKHRSASRGFLLWGEAFRQIWCRYYIHRYKEWNPYVCFSMKPIYLP